MTADDRHRATNIGARQCRRRRLLGISFMAAGLFLTAILVTSPLSPLLRLSAFGLFLPGVLNLLEAREHT